MRRFRAWTALAAGLLAGGCATGPPPVEHFYRLAAPEAAASLAAPRFDGLLAVEPFRSDGLLRERALVYGAGAGSELRQHAYHAWVAPPTDMLQEALVAFLRGSNVARTVVVPEMRLRPDYLVTGRLLRFERRLGEGGPGVVVELRLGLMDVRAGRALWTGTYREEAPARGDEIPHAVAAFDAAVGRLFGRFVEDLAR